MAIESINISLSCKRIIFKVIAWVRVLLLRLRARLGAPTSIELRITLVLQVPALDLVLYPIKALLKEILHFLLAYSALALGLRGLHGGITRVVALDVLDAGLPALKPAFFSDLLLDILGVLLASAPGRTCFTH